MANHFGSAAPRISVIFPVYNADKYVREALDSILAQTFRDFELLVLDDGSTDHTLRILREFEAMDGRVRVVSRENKGLVVSLNELIALSRACYLARMDADDICRPERFENQVAYLEAHHECVAVGSRVLLVDMEGMPICTSGNELCHPDIDAALLSGAAGIMGMCHPSVMMRRAQVLRVGAYRAEYQLAEDLDLFLRLAEVGKLANVKDDLLIHRQHLGSIGYARRGAQSRATARVLEAAYARRNLVGVVTPESSTAGRQSNADAHRKWAWWALAAGNVRTARKHAAKALLKGGPFKFENLKVVACAIRGH